MQYLHLVFIALMSYASLIAAEVVGKVHAESAGSCPKQTRTD